MLQIYDDRDILWLQIFLSSCRTQVVQLFILTLESVTASIYSNSSLHNHEISCESPDKITNIPVHFLLALTGTELKCQL